MWRELEYSITKEKMLNWVRNGFRITPQINLQLSEKLCGHTQAMSRFSSEQYVIFTRFLQNIQVVKLIGGRLQASIQR